MNSGTYKYFLNGEPTGVIETFEIAILSDGSKQTTSIRDAKPFSTMITVETIEKDDKFQTCKINYKKGESEILADYEFSENSLQVLRKFNGEIVQNETLDLPQDAIFFPLMRCFQGQTILQIARLEEFAMIIVPDIQSTTDFSNFLQPTFDERTAEWIAYGTIKFGDKLTDARIYKYLSKHYDEKSEFWIAPNGLLFSYTFKQSNEQLWEVNLQTA